MVESIYSNYLVHTNHTNRSNESILPAGAMVHRETYVWVVYPVISSFVFRTSTKAYRSNWAVS